ncbi:protein-glutamate methylesterase/protein-glutamine glutaminase [Cellulomonas fengjieae]|uniref:Protein-glutamate methylesterase/protein-glutamine glutaminase n=1 Tax=Cellulomonas fengjieae TaxID=2819978 RepID=A0ABS3SLQ7_9CELL|nr:chemotaxis response regulator protein-glutamate methylesterase [Cellulomonas fengjieae]MBO3086665.1 chemotaxis response regulator protein-glutamate methylesterase [Cellulomonas fengjieae]MBO3100657.1 chemotaxis response regulator protein-glutamate methylesterase [Cellulomonas fengjieae]QVI66487.1 chemotaxis response regulator protein-glutamate methylesterase [Cellulomonas fengjieae]
MSRIRVLVVDDSVVIRRLVSDALSVDPEIEVVGVAANGRLALARIAQLVPDLVTMDIEMPEMDGIEAVRELRRAGNRVPVVMFSTLTERGASATLDALAAGAQDYVTKPANVGSVQESLAQVAENLIPKIKALVGPARGRVPLGTAPGRTVPVGTGGTAPVADALLRPLAHRAARPAVTLRAAPAPHAVRAVVLGSSTGGPEALSRLLGALTVPPPVPVLVVQHMPPVFTRQLAARLDRLGPARVVEAEDGTELLPGTVHVAPGDRHLEVRRRGTVLRTALVDGPPVNFCRPSVDVLFRSAVHAYGGDLLAVVLTGMGADGRTGCEDVVTAGGTVVVQDEPTSVVWGMPGAVATAGLAHRMVPLLDVAPTVERLLADAPDGGARWA